MLNIGGVKTPYRFQKLFSRRDLHPFRQTVEPGDYGINAFFPHLFFSPDKRVVVLQIALPIRGAGLYVDNDVGAAGSTGRGEANLYNLTSFLIVENMRRGMHPKDAGMEGLKRIKVNTVEKRLLNNRGEPAFNIRFFILNAKGEYAGVAMYAHGETTYGLCTENGVETPDFEALLNGSPTD